MTDMTVSRKSYHHGDLANALVREALARVEAHGAEAFSLREAARAVGVTANAAYRHFADRSALLDAVTGVGFAELEAAMATARDAVRARGPKGACARLEAVGRAYVEFALARPRLFRLMFGPSCSRLDTPPPEGGPFALLSSALDELVATGALAPARRPGAELKAWSVVHGFASLAVDGEASLRLEGPRRRALDDVLRFTVDGIVGPQALAPRT